jgi:integrase/recombinase XerD
MTASLYDANGQRKYLTPNERVAFLRAADDAEREIRTFCHTLALPGAEYRKRWP